MNSAIRTLALLALAIPATTLGQAQLEIQLKLPRPAMSSGRVGKNEAWQ